MLSASYVTLRNGMCFHSELIILSGSGELMDHVQHIKQEYAPMHPIVVSTVEINSCSMVSIYDKLGIEPLEANQIVLLNKD